MNDEEVLKCLETIRLLFFTLVQDRYIKALDIAIDSIKGNYKKTKADERRKVVKSIQEQVSSINNEYVDACVMCTKSNCDECATKTIIELLEKISDIVRKEDENDE